MKKREKITKKIYIKKIIIENYIHIKQMKKKPFLFYLFLVFFINFLLF
jgi:hypothetical protein